MHHATNGGKALQERADDVFCLNAFIAIFVMECGTVALEALLIGQVFAFRCETG